MRKLPFALAILSAASLRTAVHAKPDAKAVGAKAAPACGVKIMPFVAGASWTYENVGSPVTPDEKLKKLSPDPAKMIVITVKSVDAKGADTVVSLEEKVTMTVKVPGVGGKPDTTKLAERTLNTTVTCNAKKFEISPDSFFFAGEPGGYINMTFDKVDRPKGGWTLTNGTIGEGEFREDIIAHWTRKWTEGTNLKSQAGSLELERKFTPQNPEQIMAKAGNWKAEKLGFVTTGRITLDQHHPENKPMELPAGWTTQMWLVDNVGLVQVINGFSHMYQLTATAPK